MNISRTTTAQPVVVDIAVTLTALVRPEPEAGGYSASIPALPGCHTQGEILDEVRANLREAAEGCTRLPGRLDRLKMGRLWVHGNCRTSGETFLSSL